MIKKLMKNLDITEEEARQVIADDNAIDHNVKLFELSAEQQKASKQARQVARTPVAWDFTQKRERRVDEDKRYLIELLVGALSQMDNLKVENQEREILFEYNHRKFKIVLSAPRK